MSLSFDVNGFYEGLKDRLIVVMDDLMNGFYNEAVSGLNTEGKMATKIEKTVLTDKPDLEGYKSLGETEEYLIARCKFYAEAIMQSFGTGSKADTRSIESYWDEYKNSELFNKSRNGTYIAGRKKGYYTDIYGDQQKTGGTLEGQNIEGMTFPDTGKITPRKPTYSIQNAENWIIRNSETRIERRIKMEVEQFFANEASKYIIVVGD